MKVCEPLNYAVDLGIHAFSWCNELAEPSFDRHFVYVGDECFRHCVAFTKCEEPRDVEYLGARIFTSCDASSML